MGTVNNGNLMPLKKARGPPSFKILVVVENTPSLVAYIRTFIVSNGKPETQSALWTY